MASNQKSAGLDFESKFQQMLKHKTQEIRTKKEKNVFHFLVEGENSPLFSGTQFNIGNQAAFLVKQVNPEKESKDFFQQLIANQYGIFSWSFDLSKGKFVLPAEASVLVLGKFNPSLTYDDFYSALQIDSLKAFSLAMEKAINLEEGFEMELEFEHSPRAKAEFSCSVFWDENAQPILRGLLKKKEIQEVPDKKFQENIELWLNSGLQQFEVKDDSGAVLAAFGRKKISRGVEWKDGKRVSTIYDFRNQPRYQVLVDVGHQQGESESKNAAPEKAEETIENLPFHFSNEGEKFVALTQWLGLSIDAEVATLGVFDGNRFEWKAWWKSPGRYAIPVRKNSEEWLPNNDWLVDLEINNQISGLRHWWNQADLPFEISPQHGEGWMIISENIGERLTALFAIKTSDPQSVKEKTAHVMKGLGLLKKSIQIPEKQGQTLQEEIRQKDLLIKEINHRAKNNLALAASLVKMEAGFSSDTEARKVLKSTQKRLETLASIHELMYKDPSAQDSVDMKAYLTPLVNGLVSSFGNSNLSLELHVDSVYLDVKKANTVGLLVNELISNAFKHAFLFVNQGILKVDFLQKGEFIKLRVSDNGPGFDSSVSKGDSLGNLLIEEFSKQLNAKMEIDHSGGTTFLLEFKK